MILLDLYPPSAPPPSFIPSTPPSLPNTGIDLSLGLIIIVSLVVVGVVLLTAARWKKAIAG